MKIAIVVWDLNIRGGTQRQALELALALQNLGHTIDVYTYFYNKNECYADICQKLNIYWVSSAPSDEAVPGVSVVKKIINGYIVPFFSVGKSIYHLKEKIDLNRGVDEYDVINFHDYEVYKLSRIIKHPNMIWMMNDMPRLAAVSDDYILAPILSFFKRIFTHLLLKIEIRNIKKIIVLDKRNYILCKRKYNIDAIIVRSGIDLGMYQGIKFNRSYNIKIPKIFASSIFFPHRRFEDIVDAVEILRNRGIDVRVVINGRVGGQKPYYHFIKDRVISKGLESNIEIIKGLSEKELKEHYCEADFFIFPNNNQTWGLSVFEAMLAGCVCIVSRTSGASEVLLDNKNAILIDPLSPMEIADNIMVLSKDKNKMKEISLNAVDFVEKNLSWDNYARQMLFAFE